MARNCISLTFETFILPTYVLYVRKSTGPVSLLRSTGKTAFLQHIRCILEHASLEIYPPPYTPWGLVTEATATAVSFSPYASTAAVATLAAGN
jgi:hypothetical protein